MQEKEERLNNKHSYRTPTKYEIRKFNSGIENELAGKKVQWQSPKQMTGDKMRS